MDVLAFPLDYNDVDLCLRLREKGYSNVVQSHVVVVHHEGATKRQRPEMVTRSGMLAAEQRLLAKGLVADPFTNPNLLHGVPSFAACPPRPWRAPAAGRVLVIGGDRPDMIRSFAGGDLPLLAELDGTRLRMVEPSCLHGAVVDLRDGEATDAYLRGYDVTHVLLRRLGDGSSDALGAFVRMAQDGMAVSYVADSFEAVCPRGTCSNDEGPCGHKWKEPTTTACQTCIDRCGSRYGFVSVGAWRAAWVRFANALTLQGIAAESIQVQTDA